MKDSVFGIYGEKDTSAFSIRELNYARARLGVLYALIREIEDKKYEEIRIKDLCRKAEISEPSFYNYFPKKDDLFLYFIGLWSIDVWLNSQNEKPGIGRIRKIFSYTASQVKTSTNLLKEIIAYQARTDVREESKEVTPPTAAEKTIVFGKCEELHEIPVQGLGPLLMQNIEASIQNKELPAKTDSSLIVLLTAGLFFGIPVITIHNDPEHLSDYYDAALRQIWNTFQFKGEQHGRKK